MAVVGNPFPRRGGGRSRQVARSFPTLRGTGRVQRLTVVVLNSDLGMAHIAVRMCNHVLQTLGEYWQWLVGALSPCFRVVGSSSPRNHLGGFKYGSGFSTVPGDNTCLLDEPKFGMGPPTGDVAQPCDAHIAQRGYHIPEDLPGILQRW